MGWLWDGYHTGSRADLAGQDFSAASDGTEDSAASPECCEAGVKPKSGLAADDIRWVEKASTVESRSSPELRGARASRQTGRDECMY